MKVQMLSESHAEFRIYGPIGRSMFDDSATSAEQVADELEKIPAATQIDLRLNTYGGEVFEAYAIFANLMRHPANVTAYVDGVAASAGTDIMLAASKVVMAENSMIMIHEAGGVVWGTASVIRKYLELVDALTDQINQLFVRKTGQDLELIQQLMRDETWMKPDRALELGFVDEVDEIVIPEPPDEAEVMKVANYASKGKQAVDLIRCQAILDSGPKVDVAKDDKPDTRELARKARERELQLLELGV